MSRRAVVIFARSPRVEAAEKRLPARLFSAIFVGWVRYARRCGAELIVACEAAEREHFSPAAWIEQSGTTFGERLANAVAATFARGFDAVVVTGIDVAPPAEPAFERLETADVILAPSTDGGINLLGLRAPAADLLRTFRPSDPTLIARCRDYFAGRHIVEIEPSIDIDSESSVEVARRQHAWRMFRSLLQPHLAPVGRPLVWTSRDVGTVELRGPP